MPITSVANPVYGDAANETILCQVTIAGVSGSHPYLAVEGDAHGGTIYADLVAGKYGAIGAYVAPAVSVDILRAYANQKLQSLIGVSRLYTLTGGLQVYADATSATILDLQGLMQWGTSNGSATTNWVEDSGGVVTLTGAQCVALAEAVLAYGQSAYAVLAQAMNGIANASITATAPIDALAWPV